MAKAAKTLPPQDPLTAGRRALHKRRNAAQDRRDALGLLGRVVVLAAAAWVLFTQVFLLTQASGNSMFPAVKDGDLLIGYRLQGTYAKNDVVLYEQDGKLRVGRVLGRENDLIALDDSGTLIVNGSGKQKRRRARQSEYCRARANSAASGNTWFVGAGRFSTRPFCGADCPNFLAVCVCGSLCFVVIIISGSGQST